MNRCSVVASILGLCFFASCQKGSFISGQYSIDRIGHNTTIPIEHWFLFEEDSLFTYYYSSGFHKELSSGKWYTGKRSNEIQIASSISDNHNIPITVLEDFSNDSTTTFVLDNDSIPYAKWNLSVNGTDYGFSDNQIQINHRIIVEELSLTVHVTFPEGDTAIIPFPLWDSVSSSTYRVSDRNSNLFFISFPQPINFDIFYYTPINEMIRLNKRCLWYKDMRFKRRN